MAVFFLGLFGIVIGFLMVWKPAKFVEGIGEPSWSEKVFGFGHGATAYQAIGVGLIIISIMIMTGLIQGMFLSVVGPLFGAVKN